MTTINKLGLHVQRLLAAGEIIERPASIVRELIDNAIDANAHHISLTLEQGGLSLIVVQDDGDGMNKDDLHRSYKQHFTSKLAEITDFETLQSLGFRGEALSSITSVSKTSIQSGTSTNEQSHTIELSGGTIRKERSSPPLSGTIITVSELFHHLPARRKFMRSARVEQQYCKQVFFEKASAHPDIRFSLVSNGKSLFQLPPANLVKRIAQSTTMAENAFFSTPVIDSWFQADIIASFPQFHRKDRSQIHIYVNQRKIKHFGLTQAIEYAARSVIPGGLFPIARIFLTIQPSMVDVNVHPAKQEVRIKNIQYIHHRLSTALQRAYEARMSLHQSPLDLNNNNLPSSLLDSSSSTEQPRTYTFFSSEPPHPISEPEFQNFVTDSSPHAYSGQSSSTTKIMTGAETTQGGPFLSTQLNNQKNISYAHLADSQKQASSFRAVYIMQIYKKYLICMINGICTVVDQHAAHERLLYNEFRENQDIQELTTVIPITNDEEQMSYLTSIQKELLSARFQIITRDGEMHLASLPSILAPQAQKIAATLPKKPLQEYIRTLYAQLACSRAIKAGDIIPPKKAQELIEKIAETQETRCPHGRPVLFSLSETTLDRRLGRCVSSEMMQE